MKSFTRGLALLLVLAPLLWSSCASLVDDLYTMKTLEDARKAAALADQGVQAYNDRLVVAADYSSLDLVKKYFVVALRYDPANPKARQYLDKVDSFRTATVTTKLKTVAALDAKKTRKEEDDIALFAALGVAALLDPSNPEVQRLEKEKADAKKTLVVVIVNRIAGQDSKKTDKSSVLELEDIYVGVYNDATKVVTIDRTNPDGKRYLTTARDSLAKLLAKRNDTIKAALEAGAYEAAAAELGTFTTLNKKVAGAFTPETQAATYEVYFHWAEALQKKKDYANAKVKIDIALAARRTDEALAIKAGILARNSQGSKVLTFELSLAEVDRGIDSGDLAQAKRNLEALAATVKEQAKLDLLEARRQRIVLALGALYEKGQTAYRAENFKTAIQLFQSIVDVDVDYEQASDYLDKATSKQKLLDQFSGT